MAVWIIATVCAFFIKGLCGFANTLVFTSILSFGITNINISPVELILGYPTNIIIGIRERKYIKAGICIPMTVLLLIGTIFGTIFLKNADSRIIKIIFGIVVILIGIEMLLREVLGRNDSKDPKIIPVIIGIISGLLCGLYGVGALLGAYIGRVTDSARAFKANICTIFFVENTFRIILYSFLGIITFDVLKRVLILIPFMFIGLGLGILAAKFISDKSAKKIVTIMLTISGAALILDNLGFI